MIDRDRTFHRLMAAARKKKAEDRHAREALAQDNLYLFGHGEWPVALQDTPDGDWQE